MTKRKNEVKQAIFTGERPLFAACDTAIYDTIFSEGESPLKESRDISVYRSMFKWKYPIWYAKNVEVTGSTWETMARAGVWYTDHIKVTDSTIQAPKNFRRCDGVTLEHVAFSDAAETLWHCANITLRDVTAKGDYFAMNSENIEVDGLTLFGNYSFDGVKNVVIRNSRLVTKDAFWNSENVTVYDSFISGEYLGWNAKNLTLINCTVESLQGMCYIDGLTMKNCRLIGTTLAFEYSHVEADIVGKIESVFNPASGTIIADEIGELTMEKDKIDPLKTNIVCRAKEKENA